MFLYVTMRIIFIWVIVMQSIQEQVDEKNNLVVVTLFETHLAKFILENPRFYKEVFLKVINMLEGYLSKDEPRLKTYFERKGPRYDLDRHLYTLFSRLTEHYPEQNSFESLKAHFSLSSADYFIKLVTDDILTSPCILSISPAGREASPATVGVFSKRRSPYKPHRSPLLFSDENRGVLELKTGADTFEEVSTHAIGIASERFLPEDLAHYFSRKIFPARFNYQPNESSYVARWLRERRLPLVSGASGSTEGLLSLLLPLIDLNPEERSMLIFAQACNMVANGHHSFFEAIMVADHMSPQLIEQDTLLEFYLQCVPDVVKADAAFHAFLHEPTVYGLLDGMNLEPRRPASVIIDDINIARSASFEML